MLRLAALLLALCLSAPALAQFGPPVYVPAASSGSSYIGPGDLSVGTWWAWGGLRAFSAATAGTKAANICNSGDANCADVNTLANGNFDVTTAQAAPLNCGGTGGTCTIKTLYDKSGNARDWTQATAANRYTLAFNCLNTSLPCMAATTTTQVMKTAAALPSGTVISYSAVAWWSAFTGFDFNIIGDTGPVTRMSFSGGADNSTDCFNGSNLRNTNATDATWHSLLCVINGASSVNYVDTTSASGNPGASNFVTFAVQVGSGGGGSPSEKVTEVGAIIAALTAGNQSTLCNNQRLYWGTAGTC